MAVKPQVKYPESASIDVLEALKRFAQTISENAVQIFCSTSNYVWEHDPQVPSGRYFRLMKACGGEILSEPLEYLAKASPEEFLQRLQLAQFDVNRRETLEEKILSYLRTHDGPDGKPRAICVEKIESEFSHDGEIVLALEALTRRRAIDRIDGSVKIACQKDGLTMA